MRKVSPQGVPDHGQGQQEPKKNRGRKRDGAYVEVRAQRHLKRQAAGEAGERGPDPSGTRGQPKQSPCDGKHKKVDDIAAALQAYREKNNSVSLDQRKDIVTEKLKGLNVYVTQDAAALQEAETRWKQVEACKQRGDDVLTLSFIAASPAVSQLQQDVAKSKINVAELNKRYRAKHPAMQQAMNSLTEAQNQLQRAIDTSTAQIETEYQTALQNYAKAQAALAAQENDSLKLDRFGLEYTNLERDYEVNEKLLEQILERTRETSMSSSVENENARIVDRAAPAGRPDLAEFQAEPMFGSGWRTGPRSRPGILCRLYR